MRNLLTRTAFLAIMPFLTLSPAYAQITDKVIGQVGRLPILQSEYLAQKDILMREMADLESPLSEQTLDALTRARLSTQKLAQTMIINSGYTPDPAAVDALLARYATENNLDAQSLGAVLGEENLAALRTMLSIHASEDAFVNQMTARRLHINPDEAAWLSGKIKATAGTHYATDYRVRHILVPTLQVAQAIYEALADGADFAQLAHQYSQDGSAQSGGDLGFAPLGTYVPEFEVVVQSTPPHQVSTPFATQYGYHVLEVLESRTREDTDAFATKRARNLIANRIAPFAYEAWVDELKAGNYVVYF